MNAGDSQFARDIADAISEISQLRSIIKAERRKSRDLRRHLRALTKQVTATVTFLDSPAAHPNWHGVREATADALNALDIANDTARRDGLGEKLTLRRLRRGDGGAKVEKAVVVKEPGDERKGE